MAVTEARLAAIRDEVGDWCLAHADPALSGRYARYFREGYDAYGFPPGDWEAQTAAWLAAYGPELGLAGALDLGDLLFASGKYEEGMLAIRFVGAFSGQIEPAACQRLGRWLEFGVRNWAHSDVLCGELLGPCLAGGSIALTDLADWRTSPHKFKRRAVPVSMLNLLKRNPDCPALLEFVRPLMLDGERVVHQGLGWFLRETWKVNQEPVEAFLLIWRDTAPRLIYQYATEKMSAENKARFRRQRSAPVG